MTPETSIVHSSPPRTARQNRIRCWIVLNIDNTVSRVLQIFQPQLSSLSNFNTYFHLIKLPLIICLRKQKQKHFLCENVPFAFLFVNWYKDKFLTQLFTCSWLPSLLSSTSPFLSGFLQVDRANSPESQSSNHLSPQALSCHTAPRASIPCIPGKWDCKITSQPWALELLGGDAQESLSVCKQWVATNIFLWFFPVCMLVLKGEIHWRRRSSPLHK